MATLASQPHKTKGESRQRPKCHLRESGPTEGGPGLPELPTCSGTPQDRGSLSGGPREGMPWWFSQRTGPPWRMRHQQHLHPREGASHSWWGRADSPAHGPWDPAPGTRHLGHHSKEQPGRGATAQGGAAADNRPCSPPPSHTRAHTSPSHTLTHSPHSLGCALEVTTAEQPHKTTFCSFWKTLSLRACLLPPARAPRGRGAGPAPAPVGLGGSHWPPSPMRTLRSLLSREPGPTRASESCRARPESKLPGAARSRARTKAGEGETGLKRGGDGEVACKRLQTVSCWVRSLAPFQEPSEVRTVSIHRWGSETQRGSYTGPQPHSRYGERSEGQLGWGLSGVAPVPCSVGQEKYRLSSGDTEAMQQGRPEVRESWDRPLAPGHRGPSLRTDLVPSDGGNCPRFSCFPAVTMSSGRRHALALGEPGSHTPSPTPSTHPTGNVGTQARGEGWPGSRAGAPAHAGPRGTVRAPKRRAGVYP